MKSVDVFGTKMQLSPNPMTAIYGKKELEPDGRQQICGNCIYFLRGRKSYHKCQKRGITNGAGTDHRVRWPACGLFEKTEAKHPAASPNPDSAQPAAACVKDGSRCVRTDHDQGDTWHIAQSNVRVVTVDGTVGSPDRTSDDR